MALNSLFCKIPFTKPFIYRIFIYVKNYQVERKFQYESLCFCKKATNIAIQDLIYQEFWKVKNLMLRLLYFRSSHIRCSMEKLLKKLKSSEILHFIFFSWFTTTCESSFSRTFSSFIRDQPWLLLNTPWKYTFSFKQPVKI